MSTPFATTNSTSTTSTTSGQDPIASNGQADNTFLTLMVAQIQNQTPLDPLDTTQFMTQLAQMTQVETMQTMNGTVTNQMVLLDNIQVLTTAGMVGQDVMVSTNEVELEGEALDGIVQLTSSVEELKIEVRNEDGELVETIDLGGNSEGAIAFTLDPKALDLADGDYELKVVTDDSSYTPEIMISGTIEKMRIPPGGGSPEFLIAGLGYVPFFNVTEYGDRPTSDSDNPGVTPFQNLFANHNR
ncbi:flagellar hook capping FlgD N-terminal domain-containing protein [Thaumasiovibrio sp. DFM-14]|uniref:flagellar hook capping FlgD N-terminal domain-containing protein n=1 Tax=Thaumasiovibrio sp. DFM-14 TaxID=3384792 RepID=UPI0039A1E267